MTDPPDSLIAKANQARREDRLKDAEGLFAESERLCREAADQPRLARSLTGLGQIARDLNDPARALRHYREAAAIYRNLENAPAFAHTIRHVGDILRHHDGSLKQARECYEEALTIYRGDSGTSRLDLANAIRGLALLNGEAGESEQAKSLWHEARSLYNALNVQAGVLESDRQIERLTTK